MSLLAKVVTGLVLKPLIYLIYGPEGVGKTTLAAAFGKALILDLENGSGFLEVTRLTSQKLPTFKAFMDLLNEVLSSESFGFETLAVDSLEALEAMIQKHICDTHNVKSIEDMGFGKGYVMAREQMEQVMRLLQKIRDEKNVNIVIVAHSMVKPFNDPNGHVTFDRYILRSNEKLAAIAKDLSDSVLFVTHRVDTVKQAGKDKVKAYGDGERVIYTQWRPAFDAKSRYQLPFEIPFRLENVSEVINELKPKSSTSLYDECMHLLSQITEEDRKAKALASIEAAKGDSAKLETIRKRLQQLV